MCALVSSHYTRIGWTCVDFGRSIESSYTVLRGAMIIDCIADLHGYYPELEGGDLLIVAGDLTRTYDEQEYLDFYNWMRQQNYTKKIVIAGNHDTLIEREGQEWMGFEDSGFTYLQDSGTEFVLYPELLEMEDSKVYERRKVKIWGSPWTLKFPGMNPECMAFTCDTEKQLAEKWALIPDDIDILITHGPAYGILDKTIDGMCVGSKSLQMELFTRIQPKLFICGHIHEAYGIDAPGGFIDQSINCSHVNEQYEPVNKPIRVIL